MGDPLQSSALTTELYLQYTFSSPLYFSNNISRLNEGDVCRSRLLLLHFCLAGGKPSFFSIFSLWNWRRFLFHIVQYQNQPTLAELTPPFPCGNQCEIHRLAGTGPFTQLHQTTLGGIWMSPARQAYCLNISFWPDVFPCFCGQMEANPASIFQIQCQLESCLRRVEVFLEAKWGAAPY